MRMKKTLLFVSCVLLGASSVFAQGQPVDITSGFNQDVICEDVENIATTVTQSDVDEYQGLDGGGFVFFTKEVQESGALCGLDGMVATEKAIYRFNPTGLNALVLKGEDCEGGVNTGTFIFGKSGKAGTIYALATSSDGNSEVNVVINYADGSTEDAGTAIITNWDSAPAAGSAPIVVSGLGRMASKQCWAGAAGTIQGGNNFNLFEIRISPNPDKAVVGLTFNRNETEGRGQHATVLAVSATVEVDGVSNLKLNEKNVVARYAANGQQLSAEQKGINIVKMSDGSIRKIMVK